VIPRLPPSGPMYWHAQGSVRHSRQFFQCVLPPLLSYKDTQNAHCAGGRVVELPLQSVAGMVPVVTLKAVMVTWAATAPAQYKHT
jgi:hypothetical protein